jgi:hypothetical protein
MSKLKNLLPVLLGPGAGDHPVVKHMSEYQDGAFLTQISTERGERKRKEEGSGKTEMKWKGGGI